MKEINFFYEEVNLEIDEEATSRWLFDCIKRYGHFPSITLNYIFCDDEYLLDINQKHLDHDYYTDIITFDYCEDDLLASDLYISIDRVKDNAEKLGVEFMNELHRVMIHGVLHLIGYKDKLEKDKLEMTKQENICLARLK